VHGKPPTFKSREGGGQERKKAMEARSEERKIWQRIGGQQVKYRNAKIGTTNGEAEEKAKESVAAGTPWGSARELSLSTSTWRGNPPTLGPGEGDVTMPSY
jgi:hypothetical protein